MLHAALIDHYTRGAFYPVGGTSEIAFHMIQSIEKAGGKVLVQAPVTKILCDSSGRVNGKWLISAFLNFFNKVNNIIFKKISLCSYVPWSNCSQCKFTLSSGVQVGKNDCEIHASYIISDAGAVNTFKTLLPEAIAKSSCKYQNFIITWMCWNILMSKTFIICILALVFYLYIFSPTFWLNGWTLCCSLKFVCYS